MDFKKLLQSLDQLNEADMTSRKIAGKAYGGALQHDDDEEDEDGNKKAAAPAEKRGRGRPRKAGGDADTAARYSGAKDLQNWIVGNVPKDSKALKKLPKTKHSLKEHLAKIDEMMSQLPIPVVGKEGDTQSTGAGFLNINDNSPAGQAMKDMIGKLAQQKKAQIVVPTQGQKTSGATTQVAMSEEDYSAKKARAGKDIGKPGKQFSKIAKDAAERYGSEEKGKKVAGAVLAKLRAKTNEADMPPNDALASPLTLESKQGVAEGKSSVKKDNKAEKAGKKVAKDIEYDEKVKDKIHGKKRHSEDEKAEKAGKKVAKDIEYDEKKSKKKSVKESMDSRLKAAHHRGKAHALAKEGYNCRYDDMEEARCYHEGFKEGLDECYGIMPMRGVVGEEMPAATVPGMASQSMTMPTMEDDMEEGNAFTAALARTPKGGKFSVGGKTFTDRTGYDSSIDEMAFESWDKQLTELLTEGEVVEEGMSISVSKGNQGSPDSVSVTASDSEADKLMALVKHLGVFGGEEAGSDYGSQPAQAQMHGDIEVVDDHDGMMALMKKMSGQDYEDEEGHDHGEHEEPCETCGEVECGCEGDQEEMVDETETEDQMEFEVSEDNAPDSGAAETTADEEAEAQEDEALAKADELNEWANEAGKKGTDEAFDTDMDFMLRVLAGGLNKEKSTGQTTVPVIAHQNSRMGVDGINESVNALADWKKLSGIR